MEKFIEHLPVIIYIFGFFVVFYISAYLEPAKESDTYEGIIFVCILWPILLGLLIIATPFYLLSKIAKWHKKSL